MRRGANKLSHRVDTNPKPVMPCDGGRAEFIRTPPKINYAAITDEILLANQFVRLNTLYKIVDKRGKLIDFVMTEEQYDFFRHMHTRNLILKSRQRGFTTLIQLFMLDEALFTANTSCGIIAHNREDAEKFFNKKIKLAYDNIPADFKAKYVTSAEQDAANQLKFSNGSYISVGTSMRSDTLQYLHISEYGKLCAKFPEKAAEVQSGALNAVDIGATVIIESTAEGAHGHFFDLCTTAKRLADDDADLSPMDYKFFFYPWWLAREYRLDDHYEPDEQEARYFKELKEQSGVLLDRQQMNWYLAKGREQGEKMWREFPSCVTGDALVATGRGLVPLRDVQPDDGYVLAHYAKGVQPVFRVETERGYSVTATAEHPILCADGAFRQITELVVGDEVQLSGAHSWPTDEVVATYAPVPFVDARIAITVDMALFIGLYMGDGSYNSDTISMACDKQDDDLVAEVVRLLTLVAGEPYIRYTGSNKGCAEVRVSRKALREPFDALGLLRSNSSGQLKRNICVPECIRRSPRAQIAAFLRGLFEADGFVCRKGNSVKFFAKDRVFIGDVQLLLLQFGISSSVRTKDRTNSAGYTYTGSELVLRTEEARIFIREIGFISERKRARCAQHKQRPPGAYRCKPVTMTDAVRSIVQAGREEVFDITTSTKQFTANGIVVHNCPDEAFRGIIAGAPLSRTMAMLRREGRMRNLPWLRGHLVHTFWDLGRNDKTAIWFMQHVGHEIRFFDYIEDNFIDLSYYAKLLNEKPYSYDTHHLPHDADVIEMTRSDAKTREEVIRGELLSGDTIVVDRIASEEEGVNMTRQNLVQCWFDAKRCEQGILCLEQVRYRFDERLQEYQPHLMRTKFKHGYDAMAQYGHGYRHLSRMRNDKPEANGLARADRLRKQGAPAAPARGHRGGVQPAGSGRRSGLV